MRNSTNGDRSHNSHEDNQSNAQTARPCFYTDFMKCQPLNFKGTEGVVGLTRWIEKMESVFNINGKNLRSRGIHNDLGRTQEENDGQVLSSSEIQKLEIKLWNLKVKGNDVPAYTKHFQDSVLKTTVPLGGCPIAFLSTGNICVSRTPAVAGKVPYLIALVALLGAWAIVVKMALGALGQVSPVVVGASVHFKRDCPRLKNKNWGNRNAQGWVYAVRNTEKNENASGNPDSNVITDNSYEVELADGKNSRGRHYSAGLHFKFLKPSIQYRPNAHRSGVLVEFLVMTKAPTGEDLGEPLSHDSKAQEYTEKGCQIFLAQISAKKEEDKSEGKQLQDVPIVRYFPEVFPEDLPGLLPARPVESIILILRH
ncbi:hypothetical protein Tco_0576274 [Tanacetum coccineum]